MNELIAIVEDEQDIRELVVLSLSRSGFRTAGHENGSSFLRDVSRTKPDLLILDLMLPDTDGLDICRFVRSSESLCRIPIIMLTAKSGESDKVVGLELGADDYVTKPFSARELVARVRAVLRRGSASAAEHGDAAPTLRVGDAVLIDPLKYEVTVNGKPVRLTTTEFRILKLLAEKKRRVFSREQLLDYLWGHDKAVLDRTIDVHIKNLREKLGTFGACIRNVRGVGYKLEE